MPKITVINAETDELFEREMNADELVQKAKDDAAHQVFLEAEAEAAAKKAAAEAKLAALGLTADDLKALGLGGN